VDPKIFFGFLDFGGSIHNSDHHYRQCFQIGIDFKRVRIQLFTVNADPNLALADPFDPHSTAVWIWILTQDA
jgi:hypothetical protein